MAGPAGIVGPIGIVWSTGMTGIAGATATGPEMTIDVRPRIVGKAG